MIKRNLSVTCGLRLRLLLSHFAVMAIAMAVVAAFSHSYKSRAFSEQLAMIRQQAIAEQKKHPDKVQSINDINNPVLQSFHSINTRGSLLALGIGCSSLSVLSWAMAYAITRPVRQIEQAVHNFASGKLDSRVPASSIPELHRLGLSINNMAMSLQGHEERKRNLMGDLAHEMGTPLTVIAGYLEMMQEGGIQSTHEILSQMHEETLRLNRLRADVLELSKVEAGYLPLNLEQFNPKAILSGLVTTFQAVDAVKRNCRIHLICQDNLPDLVADRDRFKQIAINLIRNAINYTPAGTVTVRAWSESTRLWFAVVDTGIGITGEDLPYVFERFWRADKSRQAATGGSGIGLALTKKLIERQGGQIEVESELGKGTTFRFWLPAFETSFDALQFRQPACAIGEIRKVA